MLIGTSKWLKISSCTATSGDRQEGQRRDQRVIAAFLGGVLAVVGRVVVLDGPRELTDLLSVDLEVVRVPVVGSDDVFSDAHAGSVFRSRC